MAAPEKPFAYASSSSVYGRAETLPTTEDTLVQLIPAYHGNFGGERGVAALLHRLRPAPAAGPGVQPLLHREFTGRPLNVDYRQTERGDVRNTGGDTTRAPRPRLRPADLVRRGRSSTTSPRSR